MQVAKREEKIIKECISLAPPASVPRIAIQLEKAVNANVLNTFPIRLVKESRNSKFFESKDEGVSTTLPRLA